MKWRNRGVVLVGLWVALTSTRVAVAAPPGATERFELGVQAMKRGDYATACPLIAESVALDAPPPGALFTLGECWARAGKIASAWSQFQRFLDAVSRLPKPSQFLQAKRVAQAKRRRDELAPLVPWLTIEVSSGVPKDATVELDAKTVPPEAWNVRQPIDPGPHRVVLRLSGAIAFEADVDMERGAERRVRVLQPVRRAPGPVPSARRDPTKEASRKKTEAPRAATPGGATELRVAGALVLGVGAAGLGLMAVAGITLLEKKATIDDNCDGRVCNEVGHQEAQDVPLLNVLGTVGFAVAVAAVPTGIVLLVVGAAADDKSDEGPRAQLVVDADPGVRLRASW